MDQRTLKGREWTRDLGLTAKLEPDIEQVEETREAAVTSANKILAIWKQCKEKVEANGGGLVTEEWHTLEKLCNCWQSILDVLNRLRIKFPLDDVAVKDLLSDLERIGTLRRVQPSVSESIWQVGRSLVQESKAHSTKKDSQKCTKDEDINISGAILDALTKQVHYLITPAFFGKDKGNERDLDGKQSMSSGNETKGDTLRWRLNTKFSLDDSLTFDKSLASFECWGSDDKLSVLLKVNPARLRG